MQISRKKNARLSLGKLIRVRLGDGGYCFGIVAAGEDVAFFKLHSFDAERPVDDILSYPVMFRVHVSRDSFDGENWSVLEKATLPDSLASYAVYWNQPVGSNEINLMGRDILRPASVEEVRGLERAAVWYAQHIEERLLFNLRGDHTPSEFRLNLMKVYDPATMDEIEEIQLGLPALP
jgi:hypothetical protein